MGEKTFKGKFPVTVLLAVVFLLVTVILFELAARSRWAGSYLPAPSMGFSHHLLDLKLSFLQRLVKEEGPVDCIFLGSSSVAAAVDPVVFGQSYEKITGKPIRSFNLGIGALDLPSALILTKILVKLFQPKLIIQGLVAVDFSLHRVRQTGKRIPKNPWIRYQLGFFNLEGWLADHSFFYRYFLRFRQWLEQPEFSALVARKEPLMSPYGFRNLRSKRGFVPDPQKKRTFEKKLAGFNLSQRRINTLKEIMGFCLKEQMALVLVEMPLHPVFNTFYPGGAKDPQEAMAEVARCVKSRGIVFIAAPHTGFSADRLWLHSDHLNSIGAKYYSQWLGEQIGKAVKEGLINP